MHLHASLSLLAFGIFASSVVADSGDTGYVKTCNSQVGPYAPEGSDHCYYFVADCEKQDGTYSVQTAAQLERCFGNSGGTLVGQLNGGFGGSCNNVKISGSILSASCKDYNGNYQSTSIDMDDWIGNNNGQLWCHAQWATCPT